MTKEQIELLLQAKRETRTARLCVEDGYYRSACSRAYYAMFHIACAMLLKRKLKYSKHSAVISAFGREIVLDDRVPAIYHELLIKGFQRRNRADYDFIVDIDEQESRMLVEHAERFVALADERLGDVADVEEGE